ncbi:MAG: YggT family protein [Oleiphilaceae bacterium]|nr:YggT family protein [Oleiphilaceae bacterium]
MFADIFNLVIDTIATLYLMVILLRFILQMARADFYNPISQFVVKATNPLLIPVRRVVPGFAGIDFASLVLAVAFQFLVLLAKVLVLGLGSPNVVVLLAMSLVLVVGMLLKIYFWALLIMIIASWIAPGSMHPALVLINQMCEPVMKPFRKLLPPMGGLDLSPILVFLTLQVLSVVMQHLAQQVGMGFSLM